MIRAEIRLLEAEDKMRSLSSPRYVRFESDSYRESWDNHLGARDSYLRNPNAHMANHSIEKKRESPTALNKKTWPKFPRRKIREKKREESSPAKPFLNQPCCAHVLKIVAVLN